MDPKTWTTNSKKHKILVGLMSKKWNGKGTTEHRHRWHDSIRRPWFHVFHVQNTFTVKTPAKLLSAAQASNTSIPLPPFTRHCEFSWNSRKPSVTFFTVKSLTENRSHKNISVKILRFSQTVERKTNSSGCRGLDICLSSKRSLALFQQETFEVESGKSADSNMKRVEPAFSQTTSRGRLV